MFRDTGTNAAKSCRVAVIIPRTNEVAEVAIVELPSRPRGMSAERRGIYVAHVEMGPTLATRSGHLTRVQEEKIP